MKGVFLPKTCCLVNWNPIQLAARKEIKDRCRKGGFVMTSKNNLNVYVLGSKLPLFPCNRGWSSTQ